MSISKAERIVGHNEVIVDVTSIGCAALGVLEIPEQRAQSDYPDYHKLSHLERVEKVNWVSDWVNWLRRDKNAIFNQEYAKDVLAYFNQALVSMVNDPDPQTSGSVRNLNRLVSSMYDHVYQLGEGVSEQVLSEINNENLRVLATEVIPDDIKFWGDSLVIFETLLKDEGKLAGVNAAGRPWRLERLLFAGGLNTLPQSLQRFILEASTVGMVEGGVESERTSRLIDVKKKLSDMNIYTGITKSTSYDQQSAPLYKTYIVHEAPGSSNPNGLYSRNYVGQPIVR